jgi:hypothetical protein
MSIRSLARELYRAQQKVDALQKAHDSGTRSEQESLLQELRLARKESQMLRRMLDGEKEAGPMREKFSGFGRSKR